jgi:hypothetical protein
MLNQFISSQYCKFIVHIQNILISEVSFTVISIGTTSGNEGYSVNSLGRFYMLSYIKWLWGAPNLFLWEHESDHSPPSAEVKSA